jgi:RNA polymerase sigma factor (sigma-70 family)
MNSIQDCDQKGRERFRCAQAGCQGCVNGLLLEHRKLVVAVVRKQWLGERAAFADLVQEGNIALWRAILGFDPERGLAFSTYAWRAIERAVWRAIKQAEREEGWSEWVRGEELALVLVEAEGRREQQEILWQMVSQLPERQAGIVRALYGLESGQGQTLAAVGERYGVTLERIRQIRNDALLQLRLPGMSSTFRLFLQQDSRTAYQHSQQLNGEWLRRRRGGQP